MSDEANTHRMVGQREGRTQVLDGWLTHSFLANRRAVSTYFAKTEIKVASLRRSVWTTVAGALYALLRGGVAPIARAPSLLRVVNAKWPHRTDVMRDPRNAPQNRISITTASETNGSLVPTSRARLYGILVSDTTPRKKGREVRTLQSARACPTSSGCQLSGRLPLYCGSIVALWLLLRQSARLGTKLANDATSRVDSFSAHALPSRSMQTSPRK